MRKIWHDEAWEECNYWITHDKKIYKRLYDIIKDIERHPFDGIGKPEPLKYDLSGWWSRRITDSERIIYRMVGDELEILSCRYHYDK